MDDNTKNIITLCISGYAAVISTITLIWNIANTIISKLSRFKVKVSIHDMIIGSDIMQPIKGPRTIKISIVNKSNKSKYIQSVNIKLPYKTKFGNYCGMYKQNVKFPIELKPEEEYIFDYKLNETASWMFESYREGKCKIFIVDTIKKKYKSNIIKASVFKDIYDFNIKIPSEVWALIKEK
ncbi:hypothetical protein BCD91_004531 [Clostridium beijerinckii]|uniref:hypothetical protein n=1 Tax=Clostridium beijerinckii TaxID=1520 RepID=UPI001494B730|nr:hypothetical protein [Clostridium beijerinckii]NOW92508.1 hypothetical protein [Clostridium beijerinckii]